MSTLTVMAGMPGSGKSYWVRRHKGNAVVLSADAVRHGANPRTVFGSMRRKADVALKHGHSVIIDACSMCRRDRTPWLELAHKHRCASVLVVLTTPTDVCLGRNQQRHKPVPRMSAYVERARLLPRFVVGESWSEVRYTDGSPGAR